MYMHVDTLWQDEDLNESNDEKGSKSAPKLMEFSLGKESKSFSKILRKSYIILRRTWKTRLRVLLKENL